MFEDAGISGAKGRGQRPGFDKLMKAVTRREVDMVAAWAVDRIGRSMPDLVSFLTEIHASGADLYLHQQALDTSTPAGRAMFQMMGVFAEFKRSMIKSASRAGPRAGQRRMASGSERPTLGVDVEARIRALRAEGMGILKVAKTLGIGVSAVQRVAFARLAFNRRGRVCRRRRKRPLGGVPPETARATLREWGGPRVRVPPASAWCPESGDFLRRAHRLIASKLKFKGFGSGGNFQGGCAS